MDFEECIKTAVVQLVMLLKALSHAEMHANDLQSFEKKAIMIFGKLLLNNPLEFVVIAILTEKFIPGSPPWSSLILIGTNGNLVSGTIARLENDSSLANAGREASAILP